MVGHNFILLCCFCCVFLVTGEEPTPSSWPLTWISTSTRNSTSAEGEPTGIDILIKYYDYNDASYPLYKQECAKDGIASTFTLLGTEGYVYTAALEACMRVDLPVAVVAPDWMKGGEYVGTEWLKLDHKYYESIHSPIRPTRVYTPFDQNGASHQEDYGTFTPVEQHPSDTFKVPEYCNTLNSKTSLSRRLKYTNRDVDPKGCFL